MFSHDDLIAGSQSVLLTRSHSISMAGFIARLTAVLFRETNPAPVKYVLSLLGLTAPTTRLPLVTPGEQVQGEISAALAELFHQYSDQMIGTPRVLECSLCEAVLA